MGPFTSFGFCKGEQREGLEDMEQPLLFVLFRWVNLQNTANPKSTSFVVRACAILKKRTDPFVSL